MRPSRSASAGGGLGLALDRLPVAAVGGELGERRVELDLRGQVAGLHRQLERLLVGALRLGVVGLGDLEVVAERQQRPHRLRGVGLAGQLDRALEVLAGALGVADAAEDAAEDPVGAARRRRLAEALGEAQRLLGGVDREHVVAGVHVERCRLLVEADQLDAGRAVLEQVDAALVVLDRALAVALVPERGADLAVQVADPLQVLLAAVELEALVPDGGRLVDAAEPQGDVAELLRDPGAGRGVELGVGPRARPRSGAAPPGSSRGRRSRRRPPRARRGRGRRSARARGSRGRRRRRARRRGRSGRRPSSPLPRSGRPRARR